MVIHKNSKHNIDKTAKFSTYFSVIYACAILNTSDAQTIEFTLIPPGYFYDVMSRKDENPKKEVKFILSILIFLHKFLRDCNSTSSCNCLNTIQEICLRKSKLSKVSKQ